MKGSAATREPSIFCVTSRNHDIFDRGSNNRFYRQPAKVYNGKDKRAFE